MAYFPTKVLDNQIKALPTVSTASGSVANFTTDMQENLVEVECEIIYQQQSGTPSPSNPLPILTFDHLDLLHNSINLWNEQWEVGSYTPTGEKAASTDRIRCKTPIQVSPNTNYYFKGSSIYWFVLFLGIDGVVLSASITQKIVNTVFTTPNNCYWILFYTDGAYGTTYNNDISINYPSTDTTYHAFNGAYIPFGQTVAKGKLNVTSGVLEITNYIDDLANLSWQTRYTGSTNKTLSANLTEYYKRNNAYFVAEQLIRVSGASGASALSNPDNKTVGMYDIDNSSYPQSQIIYIVLPVSDTPSGKIVYQLANSIKVQLDSVTIQALLNENNIWCDTNGDTSVKFILSVGEYVNQNV